MSTRILLLEGGNPAKGIRIRTEDDREVVSDDSGQLSLELREGTQEIAIFHEGGWSKRTLAMDAWQSAFMLVDLDDAPDTSREREKKNKVTFVDIGRLNLGERYVYEKTIGRGGMGMVIRARDRMLNREVAIKLLSDELHDNEEAQGIFLAEARHLATLSHPNLVAVHDISKVDDRVFMVMEYVRGSTLEQLSETLKGLSEAIALKLMIQLTRVVAYLHDHKVIHRDLKPANAIVRHDGTLKLVDFGLAKHFDDLYIKGTRMRGTPAYMSPEQLKGHELGPSSDIYQLGVCLFEMVTGKLPFSQGDVAYSHLNERAPRVRTIRPEISGALEDIIAACLAKEPQDRPQSAQELLALIQERHRQLQNDTFDLGLKQTQSELRHSKLRTSEIRSLRLPSRTQEELDYTALGLPDHGMLNPNDLQLGTPEQPPARYSRLPLLVVILIALVGILGAYIFLKKAATLEPTATVKGQGPAALGIPLDSSLKAPRKATVGVKQLKKVGEVAPEEPAALPPAPEPSKTTAPQPAVVVPAMPVKKTPRPKSRKQPAPPRNPIPLQIEAPAEPPALQEEPPPQEAKPPAPKPKSKPASKPEDILFEIERPKAKEKKAVPADGLLPM